MPANGLADFKRRIDEVRAAAKKAAGPALDTSAAELVDTMRILVPVDRGTLKDSIKSTEIDELTRRVSAGDARTEKTVTGVHGGERYTVDEALLVEFGTRKTPAQPSSALTKLSVSVNRETTDVILLLNDAVSASASISLTFSLSSAFFIIIVEENQELENQLLENLLSFNFKSFYKYH